MKLDESRLSNATETETKPVWPTRATRIIIIIIIIFPIIVIAGIIAFASADRAALWLASELTSAPESHWRGIIGCLC